MKRLPVILFLFLAASIVGCERHDFSETRKLQDEKEAVNKAHANDDHKHHD